MKSLLIQKECNHYDSKNLSGQKSILTRIWHGALPLYSAEGNATIDEEAVNEMVRYAQGFYSRAREYNFYLTVSFIEGEDETLHQVYSISPKRKFDYYKFSMDSYFK